jgi:hypothetical protein
LMKLRAAALTIFTLLAFAAFVCPRLARVAAGPNSAAEPQQRRSTRRPQGARRRAARTQTPRRNYAKFSHAVPQHKEQACNACHKFPTPNWNKVRSGGDAFEDVTDYPEHRSCLGCHHEQFFSGARPIICTICHTNPSPRDAARHPFPNPRELFDKSPKGQAASTEFQIYFPHDKHEGVFGRNWPGSEREESGLFRRVAWRGARSIQAADSCSNCHQTYMPQGNSDDEFVTPPPKDLPEDAFWLKKGAFKTTPTSHAACFTCHSADSGLSPAPTDCAICHRLPTAQPLRADFDPQLAATMGIRDKILLEKWRRREAGRFRHEWFSHAELACNACHDVSKINTLDEKTKKVPVASCGGGGEGCHIGEPDSVLNVAVAKKKADPGFQCMKCHVIFGRDPVPASHLNAVATVKPK